MIRAPYVFIQTTATAVYGKPSQMSIQCGHFAATLQQLVNCHAKLVRTSQLVKFALWAPAVSRPLLGDWAIKTISRP